MVLVAIDEGEHQIDDKTLSIQLQQFLDEWHYRVINSNLASTWSRNDAAGVAIDIIELNGELGLSDEQKEDLCNMDESDMVASLVTAMPTEARRTFEHFVLQLQLVISTVTRVRHAIEEVNGSKEEYFLEPEESPQKPALLEAWNDAKQQCGIVMDKGDAGLAEQVLKQCVLEGVHEIVELMEMRKSWIDSTDKRVTRLARCQNEADAAKHELDAVRSQLDCFGSEQNKKSKDVLVGVAGKRDQDLVHVCFSGWYGTYVKYKAEKDIHDKFRKQIAHAEDKLIQYKERQLANVRGVLRRQAAETDGNIMDDIISSWRKITEQQKGDKVTQAHMKHAQEKLAHMQSTQLDSNRKMMTRMSAGNDITLMELCWQAWDAYIVDYKKNKEVEDAVKKAEKLVAEFSAKKSEEAKGVLNRMSGASDSGLVMQAFQGWRDYFNELKASREMEEMMMNGEGRMKSLAGKQKGAAQGVVGRLNELEAEIFMSTFFLNWATEASLSKVIHFYSSKMDQKKHQLDAVQTMFKSFAVQLETGLDNAARSPRSQRTKSSRPNEERPPLPN